MLIVIPACPYWKRCGARRSQSARARRSQIRASNGARRRGRAPPAAHSSESRCLKTSFGSLAQLCYSQRYLLY